MKSFLKLISKLFFLFILLAGQANSIDFREMCLKWRNCKQVFISEGFHDGCCRGFIRKCVCKKPCF
ncbi:hypothetical protein BRARA_I03280 [Brassica rapa]|uniref:Knottins-like domain-containing protein n=1 Tax=Brassica campestris TaxID=3711 RepID=A0A397Y9T5_BRACM|nr:hypothetical protein BRARA_I03280 [Brassica rapa]